MDKESTTVESPYYKEPRVWSLPLRGIDRTINFLDKKIDWIPTNFATGARALLAHWAAKRGDWLRYTPATVTEENFSAKELMAMYNMYMSSKSGKGITAAGVKAYNKRRGKGGTSLRKLLTDPATIVETTIGQAPAELDKNGRVVALKDIFDFNAKRYGDRMDNRMYREKAKEPDASFYTKLRALAPEILPLDTDPHDSKVHSRIDFEKMRKIIVDHLEDQPVQQDSKGGDAGKGSGAPEPSPKAGRTRRDVRAAEGAGDTRGWTWENYRWNPGSKGGHGPLSLQQNRTGGNTLDDLVRTGLGTAAAKISDFSEKLPAMRRQMYSSDPVMLRAWRGLQGAVADRGIAHAQKWIAKGTTKMQELRDWGKASGGIDGAVAQGLGTVASTVGSYAQPLLGGVRQAIATHTSEGGKWYTPQPNTEQMFSRDALQELSEARKKSGGKGIVSSRAYSGLLDVLANPARFEAEAPTGSMTERDGALTDVADMNLNYQGGDVPHDNTMPVGLRVVTGMANAVGNAFAAATGSSDDPDAGKIHTRIPVNRLESQQDSKGGDAGEGSAAPVPESETPVRQGGPHIVINPSVFNDDKDALCVAFNEAFRVVMESMEFNPVSEPTEEQRRFFADTAYSQDENQMRRTILARIATFDTSIKDPTDEQIEETVEFLQSVLEAEIPQTEFEQNAVLRILDTLRQVRSRGTHMSDSSSEASESMPPPSLT